MRNSPEDTPGLCAAEDAAMAGKLSPCPFCEDGGTVYVQEDAYGDDRFHAECSECGAEGPYRESEIAARTSWNHRPGEQRLRAMNAVLRQRMEALGYSNEAYAAWLREQIASRSQ